MKAMLILLLGAVLCLPPAVARADEPLVLGFTAVKDCVGALVASEQGFFQKHGLNVQLRLMQNSATEATAIVAGAMALGCNVPPVLLQAIDHGVGLVGLAGASVSDPAGKATAAIARPGAGIASAADFAGKKVGVSGIGSNGYVMFAQWLTAQHVDFKRVSFFEVPFGTQYDVLKRGTVDAVVSVTPILTRILNDKTGVAIAYLESAMPPGTPLVIYVTSNGWADKNPGLVNAVRQALAEGTRYALAHPDQADQYVAKYLNQPLATVQAASYWPLDSRLTGKQMQWWVDAMKTQGLIQSNVVPANVVAR
jgi:NitT/TauT family transport system substrate-binding protein